MELMLMNGQHVEISQDEVKDFITQQLIPNPYWRHSGLLTEEEVMRFLKGESTYDELKKIARYILIYQENLTFTAYLFDKSEGHPDQGKEFNMPAVKELRDLYQKTKDDNRNMSAVYHIIYQMENVCLDIGADPL